MFGMGTGVSPDLWSPTNQRHVCRRDAEVLAPRIRMDECVPTGSSRPLGLRDRRTVSSLEPCGSYARPACESSDSGCDPYHATHSRRLAGMIKHSTVRTVRLRAFQPLHPRPINLVVYQGSFACATMPHLKGGFTLRCFQRLSLPNVATQRCTERCNWITRGWSNPILSY